MHFIGTPGVWFDGPQPSCRLLESFDISNDLFSYFPNTGTSLLIQLIPTNTNSCNASIGSARGGSER